MWTPLKVTVDMSRFPELVEQKLTIELKAGVDDCSKVALEGVEMIVEAVSSKTSGTETVSTWLVILILGVMVCIL